MLSKKLNLFLYFLISFLLFYLVLVQPTCTMLLQFNPNSVSRIL